MFSLFRRYTNIHESFLFTHFTVQDMIDLNIALEL